MLRAWILNLVNCFSVSIHIFILARITTLQVSSFQVFFNIILSESYFQLNSLMPFVKFKCTFFFLLPALSYLFFFIFKSFNSLFQVCCSFIKSSWVSKNYYFSSSSIILIILIIFSFIFIFDFIFTLFRHDSNYLYFIIFIL